MAQLVAQESWVSAQEEMALARVPDSRQGAAVRPAGGVSWRPGVPHIVLLAGDEPGCAPFPPTQNLALENGWYGPFSMDPEYIVGPYSERASGGAHINLFKTASDDMGPRGNAVWNPDYDWPFRDYNGRWEFIDFPGDPEYVETYSRFGYPGDGENEGWYWVAPRGAATVPMALEALAELDIAVIGLHNYFEALDDPHYSDQPSFWLRTLDELNTMASTAPGAEYNSPTADEFIYYFWYDENEYGGNEYAPFSYATISHLTGAVHEDGIAMTYSLNRQTADGFVLETVEDLAARLVPDIIDLAGRMGNSETFDIAILVDSSGSFSSSESRATLAFLALIDAFRAEQKDIYVGVARYSEYAYRSFSYGAGGEDELPYVMQYPVSPVLDDESRDALVLALETDVPGTGGDTWETVWEGLYQIATGAGFDGNFDGDKTDSGPPGVAGTVEEAWLANGGDPTAIPDSWEALWDLPQYIDFDNSVGAGYSVPGFSGDVPPSFGGGGPRGVASVAELEVWVRHYDSA